MKYDRLTEKDIDICTWDSPKPKVKIKPMPFLTIYGNVYSPQEQANIRLKYLEDLIEQGKLIELPCKVGDTVYVIRNYIGDDYSKIRGVSEGFVKHIYFNKNNKLYFQVISYGIQNSFISNGKTSNNYVATSVFTDKAEAEKQLETEWNKND